MEDENNAPNSSPSFAMKTTISMIQKKFPSVQNISTEQLETDLQNPVSESEQSLDQNKVLLLDCRPPEEYDVSHIEGGVQINYEDSIEHILTESPELLKNKKKIVCYCSVGYRSSMVAEKLQKYYQSRQTDEVPLIYNLEGSLFKWGNEGRKMVDANSVSTPYVHPYNFVFGKLLNSELRRKVRNKDQEDHK